MISTQLEGDECCGCAGRDSVGTQCSGISVYGLAVLAARSIRASARDRLKLIFYVVVNLAEKTKHAGCRTQECMRLRGGILYIKIGNPPQSSKMIERTICFVEVFACAGFPFRVFGKRRFVFKSHSETFVLFS